MRSPPLSRDCCCERLMRMPADDGAAIAYWLKDKPAAKSLATAAGESGLKPMLQALGLPALAPPAKKPNTM